ncbi:MULTISPECIES: flagellar hook-length control protein FliK [Methylobacterium]|uniref:Flagellar hook-length control protein-like C-terminal domain-containing protein n=1 Tax=Methylobacterium thuringiense TaxID=1003091 RepID=A0ABQ4TEQ0_9HYPH|nr:MULTISPECIES: flagellar hook-length control protein FliK [Methylobacterium]TXN24268.1 hypothetical protein FV217_03435 [Methylobacterium sp. WL9]GJE53849.1 hypothetical protein EKPJFOCH_0317 [Methylobacterium thuringiense]
MSLTLKDVVESRVQQRASGVQRDLAETRDPAQTRRERFSLEESDRRAARDSQIRSSSAGMKTAATDMSKADGSKTSERPAQADRSAAAGADRATRAETSTKPASPGPAALTPPAKPQVDTTASAQSEAEATKSAPAELDSSTGDAESKTAATAETAVTSPMMAIFVAPLAEAPPPLPTASKATAFDPDEESGIEAADGAAKGAGSLGPGTGKTVGPAVAVKPEFEAALAEIAAGAPGGDTMPSIAASGTDPAAATAPSSSPDVKAASASNVAAHLQASPSSAPIPLGAVPMTIGLRALGASSRFEIRLDPKELGRVDVSIDIDKDQGTVGVRLVVDRPETLALLQRDASTLQQALSQTGFDASAGVSLSLRGDEAGTGRNGRETGDDAQSRGGAQADRPGLQGGPDHIPIDLVPLRALRGIGRVDIRI